MFNILKTLAQSVIQTNNNLLDICFTRLESHVSLNSKVLNSYTINDAQAFRDGEPDTNKENELEIAMLNYWYTRTYQDKKAKLDWLKKSNMTQEYRDLEDEIYHERKQMLLRLINLEELLV